MTTDQMRETLINRYPGPKWEEKVNRMGENQVVAIFKSLERKNQLSPNTKTELPFIKIAEPEQVSLFNMYPDLFKKTAR